MPRRRSDRPRARDLFGRDRQNALAAIQEARAKSRPYPPPTTEIAA